MKYLSEFRDERLARMFTERICERAAGLGQLTFMEVCGSHTMAIARYGIRRMLPENIELISGPGCPVCVTPNKYLDHAIALGRKPEIILSTFGDMLRVPGSTSSLEKERANGSDIRVVYSTMDAVEIARRHPDKLVVFLGVGFETTAPTIAASIVQAEQTGVSNYFVLCAHKTMPKPMEAIASGKKMPLDGFICPAHVSTIIGSRPYDFLAEKYGKYCVIAGFEPVDILESVDMLIAQAVAQIPKVEIQYSRVATVEGNPTALHLMADVFEVCDAQWRGIGDIPASGLRLKERYSRFDAAKQIAVEVEPTIEETGCICGEVMQGLAKPPECPLFGTVCTPESPVGACMVSSEGSCAASYKYEQVL